MLCPHNSVIKEWGVNASDEIVRICRRFLCQYLYYFTARATYYLKVINKLVIHRTFYIFFFSFKFIIWK